MENTHLLQEKQVVIFSLSREEYGLPITRVQEINRLAPITKLPQTPDFMEGIINLRGRVIPVIERCGVLAEWIGRMLCAKCYGLRQN